MARRFRREWHREGHFTGRLGWLRAAVLGANDGVLSVASLVTGVAAAEMGRQDVLIAGVAGWLAGALSMAAGEYVSVSSQADSEHADLKREEEELEEMPEAELDELAGIYVKRGLQPDLAREVARQLTDKDALEAHARDELGISEATQARPLQAAAASAISFTVGSVLPLLVALLAPLPWLAPTVIVTALLFLAALGFIGARTGGADPWRATLRVVIWSAAAMLATTAVGRLLGTVAG
jgi:VIT1/CCC1 family predicted Fe2+/Mn2+ transporter